MNRDPMDMFGEMDEVFDRLFSRMDREFFNGSLQESGYRDMLNDNGMQGGMAESILPAPGETREPVAEVHQIGDETMVITELPGAEEDSLRIAVRGSRLVIDAGAAEDQYHTTAALPPVDVASMQHSFRHGVLEVTFRNLPGAHADSGKT